MSEILLAGASGMIGSKLIKKLKQKNIDFVLLSTQRSLQNGVDTFYWHPELGLFPYLDLTRFSACINFCGSGIFDKPFTEKRKHDLESSRVVPLTFLREQFEKQTVKLPSFVSVSGVGYYENICLNELDENSTQGKGFIASLVNTWEKAIHAFDKVSERVCIFRLGIVFSDTGGFLEQLAKPIRYFVGAVAGSGKQNISWIHVDDLCDMLLFAVNTHLNGTFNAVAPHPETLETITKQVAKTLKRPLLLPHIPVWALRLIFGKERHLLLLSSQMVSSEKIQNKGFTFKYSESLKAIENLY